MAVGRAVNSRMRWCSGEFGSCPEERLEYGVRCHEVVMNDVYEEELVHHVGDQLARGRIGLVEFSPLVAKFVCFVLR